MTDHPFICPSCGSHYFGRDTVERDGEVVTLKTVRCHGGWSMDDPQKPACKWRGEWPPVEADLSADRKQ